MEFIAHNIAPIMFMGLIRLLAAGFPGGVQPGCLRAVFGFVGVELGLLP